MCIRDRVKDHQLFKEHQIHVVEALLVVGVQLQGGLGVLAVVVGKIAHQTAGEGRQSRDSWAPVLCQEPAQDPAGMGGPLLPVPAAPQPQHPVGTRDLQRGFVPPKLSLLHI